MKNLKKVLAIVFMLSLLLTLLLVGADAASDGVPDVTIISQDGYDFLFPDIVKKRDGSLLLVSYCDESGASHAPYQFGDSLGRIVVVDGSADGMTWGEPRELVTPEKLAEWGLGVWYKKDTNTFYYNAAEAEANGAVLAVEARDPNLAKLNDGTLLFTFFSRVPGDSTVGGHTYWNEGPAWYTWGRTYIMYSKDDGVTWSVPTEIQCNALDRNCAKRGNIAVYSDDTILIPMYGMSTQASDSFTRSKWCTVNVRAQLNSDGTWTFLNEYNTNGTSDIKSVFGYGTTEASFGTTADDTTYAMIRYYQYGSNDPGGDVFKSTDKGVTWTKIGSTNPNSMQAGFYRMSDGNLFVTWSQTPTPRKIYGRVFYPNLGWDFTETKLLYENTGGGDMADPSGIQLDNGKLLTIFYDTTQHIIGSVFNDASEWLPDAVNDSLETYAVFQEDFQDKEVGKKWTEVNSAVMTYTGGEGTVTSGGENLYLQMNTTTTLNSVRYCVNQKITGDTVYQFDYRFDKTVSTTGNFQNLFLRLGATGTDNNGAGADPLAVQFRQEAGSTTGYIRIMNGQAQVAKSADGIIEPGKTYTVKIYRVGTQLLIKHWETGTTEPDSFVLTYSDSDKVKTEGYFHLVYQNTAGDGGAYLDNVGILKKYSLELEQSAVRLLEGDAPYQLTAVLTPADSDAVITWSSSNTDVVSVDQTGKVTVVGPGEATVTASFGSYSDKCTVIVGAASDEMKNVNTKWTFFSEDFEDQTAGSAYTNEKVNYHTNPAQGTVTEDSGNKALTMKASGSTTYAAANSTRLGVDIAVSGDTVWQFDYRFNNNVTTSEKFQSIYLRLRTTGSAAGNQNTDTNVLQIRQDPSVGNVIRVMNDQVVGATTEDGVFQTGETYTCKVYRSGNTLYIKNWKKGEAEPTTYVLSYTYPNTIESGYLHLVYQCTDTAQAGELVVDNLSISKNTALSIVEEGDNQFGYAFERDVTKELPVPSVVWSSSDTAIAAIDQNGKLTEAANGSVVITAQTADGTLSATKTVVSHVSCYGGTATCTEAAVCAVCGESYGSALGHTGGTATCKEKAVCTRCETPYGDVDAENHAGGTTLKEEKAATCTEAGYSGDVYCNGCNKKLKSGSEQNALGHTETIVNAKEATTTEKGYTGDKVCSVCEYEIAKGEEIPVKTVVVPGQVGYTTVTKSGAPNVEMKTSKAELENASGILSDADKARIANGENAKIWLEVSPLSTQTLSTAEKAIIEKVVDDLAQVQCFSMELFKQIGEDEPTAISEPGVELEVTITVPEAIRSNNENVKREYCVVQMYNGAMTMLPVAFDIATGTLNLKTNQLAVYTLGYTDTPVETTEATTETQTTENPEKAGNSAQTPQTGDNSNIILWMTLLLLVAILGVLGTILWLKSSRIGKYMSNTK